MTERVVVVTAGNRGTKLLRYFSTKKNKVICLIDNDDKKWDKKIDGVSIQPFSEAALQYRKGEIDKFVIPYGISSILIETLYFQLRTLNIDDNDVLIARIRQTEIEFIKVEEFKSISYLEIPIVENCNLNCKGCSHFAPMACKKEYSINTFKQDILRLKELIDSIDIIRILGGEPLLHEKIIDFIEQTIAVYPESSVRIVSNGLLLKRMSKDFWDCVKANDVIIQITLYPVLFEQEQSIVNLLRNEGVRYTISRTGFFRKPLTKERKIICNNLSKNWDICHCTNLYNGKLSACALLMFIGVLNKAFNLDYPDDGIIDIYDSSLSGKKLVDMLGKTIPLCDYCELMDYDLNMKKYHDGKMVKWEMTKDDCLSQDDWLI